MATPAQNKVVRASGYGTTGHLKTDGYAAGHVPSSMVGTKAGKTKREPYSGPNHATISRG